MHRTRRGVVFVPFPLLVNLCFIFYPRMTTYSPPQPSALPPLPTSLPPSPPPLPLSRPSVSLSLTTPPSLSPPSPSCSSPTPPPDTQGRRPYLTGDPGMDGYRSAGDYGRRSMLSDSEYTRRPTMMRERGDVYRSSRQTGPSLSSLTGSSLDPVDSAFSQAAAYTSRFQQQHQQQQQQVPPPQQQQQYQQQPPSLLDGGNTALGGTGVAAATRSVERYMSYLSGRSSRRPNLAANPNPLLIPAASSGAFAGSNISPTSEPEANAFRRHRSRRRAIQEDRMALGGSSRMHMLHTRSGALQGTASPGEGGSGGSIVGMGMGHGASGAVSENEGAMMMMGGGGGGGGGRMAGTDSGPEGVGGMGVHAGGMVSASGGHMGMGMGMGMGMSMGMGGLEDGYVSSPAGGITSPMAAAAAAAVAAVSGASSSSPEHPFISARAKASLGLMHRRAADSAIAFRRSGAGSEDADTPQGSLSSINSEGHLSSAPGSSGLDPMPPPRRRSQSQAPGPGQGQGDSAGEAGMSEQGGAAPGSAAAAAALGGTGSGSGSGSEHQLQSSPFLSPLSCKWACLGRRRTTLEGSDKVAKSSLTRPPPPSLPLSVCLPFILKGSSPHHSGSQKVREYNELIRRDRRALWVEPPAPPDAAAPGDGSEPSVLPSPLRPTPPSRKVREYNELIRRDRRALRVEPPPPPHAAAPADGSEPSVLPSPLPLVLPAAASAASAMRVCPTCHQPLPRGSSFATTPATPATAAAAGADPFALTPGSAAAAAAPVSDGTSLSSSGFRDALEQRTVATPAAGATAAAGAGQAAGGEGGGGEAAGRVAGSDGVGGGGVGAAEQMAAAGADEAGQAERREGGEAGASAQTVGEGVEGFGRSAVLERVREVGSGAVSNSLERVVEENSLEGREEEGDGPHEDAGAGAGARQREGSGSARRGVERGQAERIEGEGGMGTVEGEGDAQQESKGREGGSGGASEGERGGGGGGGEGEAERDRGPDGHEGREAGAAEQGGREKDDTWEGEGKRGAGEGREGGTDAVSTSADGNPLVSQPGAGPLLGSASHVGGVGGGAAVGGARAGAGGGWVGPGAAAGAVQQLSLLPQQEWTIEFSELRLGIRVGVGSFGEVFRAVWRGTEVAVKMLWEQDAKPEDTEDFYNEIALLSRLRHPNVILFMGACTVPPHLSMVTEYMHMGSLYRIIHTREPGQGGESLSWKRRYKMLRDICRGMLCLQRMSIIHRDLKSANCLVDRHWCVKVCDFGLSRIATNGHVVGRTAAGTPEWMAPELLRNERCSFKCDVFSLGVIMWELATLRRPWEDCNGPLEVAYAVAHHNSRLPVPSTSLGRLIS
ncbi:unnamed protein product, partial [Closterium sp. Naga37s-1]